MLIELGFSNKHKHMTFIKKHAFILLSVAVLFLTTVYWSVLSAIVQQQNADQLADPALFKDMATFSQSVFPAQHTFLLKWPLFALVEFMHGSMTAYVTFTVLVCLVTVGIFAWILSRIEKRTTVLAVLLLVMSAVLLLVPIEPRPGSLLPVGMGMLATRNLEYIVLLLAGLLLFKDTPKYMSEIRTFVAGILLTILFVTDQLFTGLAIGGAVLLLVFAYVTRRKFLKQRAIKILIVTIVALVVSIVTIIAFRYAGLIDASQSAAGPYGVSLSIKNLVLGIAYAVMGVLSQFGANPVSSTVIAADIPGAIVHSIRSLSIIGYLVNGIILVSIIVATTLLIKRNAKRAPIVVPTKRSRKVTVVAQDGTEFALYIIACTITAIGLFIVTNHYYAVDARYVGIVFFAGFIALAVIVSKIDFSQRAIMVVSVIALIGCFFGIIGAYQSFHSSWQAYIPIRTQNTLIARAIEHHPVKTLVADYWRVYPIVNDTKIDVKPLPLDTCFESRKVLTSRLWQQDVYKQSFAYLLTTGKTSTGYPACELAAVRQAFGSPSDTLIVEGTAADPKTMVLFYDYGIHKAKTEANVRSDDTSFLRNLDELKDTTCKTGRMVVQTVAHQDDDILFMNPDMIRGASWGDCLRTIYFTAGDAGVDEAYWLAREEGARAAYAQLVGDEKPIWKSRDVIVSEGHQVKISQLESQQGRVSLIFMHLPDGNINGSGFANDNMQSLQKLMNGAIPSISSIDGASVYTKAAILANLGLLLDHYKPILVRTQAVDNHSHHHSDHSDHLMVGRLTADAFNQYQTSHPDATIQHFIGYSIRDLAPNVGDDELMQKKAMFFTYAGHDASTCPSDSACERTSYEYYLDRQYTE